MAKSRRWQKPLLLCHSDYFYARNPFTQFQTDPVTNRYIPSELYSQFGGSLSGPIIKDKTFFFVDYQGLRQRLGTTLQQNVPTLQVRNSCLTGTGTCDLSQYTNQVLYNPATKTAYSATAGQLPAAAVSTPARTLLNLLPAPNAGATGATTNNYVASGNGVENGDQADVRIDHQATDKIHAFGRYDYALFRLTGVPVFGTAGGEGFGLTNTSGLTTTQNQSATAGFDWALKPTLLTDLRVGFLSYHVSENKYPNQITATALGIPNLNTTADTAGSPTFNFNQGSLSGLGNQQCNCPLLQSEQVFQLVNNWTKTFGNHSLRFGGDLRYAKNVRNASDYNRTGQFIFDSATTGSAGVSTGSDLASFLTGYAAGFQRFDVFVNDQYSYQKRGAFYVQDTWHPTPKLTLNLGVRWDIIFPETVNGTGHGGFASLATGGIRVAGAGGFGTNGNQKMDYTNVASRFGISYQATPRTVIRAGAGQVYDTVGYFGSLYGSVLSHNLPVQANENLNQSGSLGAYVTTLGAPPTRPAAFGIPSSGVIPFQDAYSQTFRGERIQLPRVHQYNVALQQQLSTNMTFEIAYVGNLGDRIYPGETFGTDLNAPRLPATPAELAAGSNTRRPYYNKFVGTYQGAATICCSNSMTSALPNGRAIYNSLQTKLDKRFSNGLQFNANYTWSRASNFGNDEAFTQYKQITWGRNDTNRSNIFVFTSTYELPFGKNRTFFSGVNKLEDLLIGGWSLSGQTTWESGRPFTPTYAECGNDQDLDNNYSSPGITSDCRPNGSPLNFALSTGGLNTTTHARPYFTPVAALTTNGATSGAWTRPAFGTFGTSPRNGLVGPRDYYADASVMKDFPITERFKGQFQFQAFNMFNHPARDIPTATNSRCIDCTVAQGAGTITSLEGNSTMRRLQFAARVTF